jgi:hypothetical protein
VTLRDGGGIYWVPTRDAGQAPAGRQARLHRAMTDKGAGVVGLIVAGGAL